MQVFQLLLGPIQNAPNGGLLPGRLHFQPSESSSVQFFFFYARLRSNSLLQQGCLRYDCRLPLHCWCHKYRFGRFGILPCPGLRDGPGPSDLGRQPECRFSSAKSISESPVMLICQCFENRQSDMWLPGDQAAVRRVRRCHRHSSRPWAGRSTDIRIFCSLHIAMYIYHSGSDHNHTPRRRLGASPARRRV